MKVSFLLLKANINGQELYTESPTLARYPEALVTFYSRDEVCSFMYIRVTTLPARQLLAVLQQLFLPHEISKETRQRESEHTPDLSQTRVPGLVLQLRFTRTPLPRPLPARGHTLLPLPKSLLSPQSDRSLKLRGGASPARPGGSCSP